MKVDIFQFSNKLKSSLLKASSSVISVFGTNKLNHMIFLIKMSETLKVIKMNAKLCNVGLILVYKSPRRSIIHCVVIIGLLFIIRRMSSSSIACF